MCIRTRVYALIQLKELEAWLKDKWYKEREREQGLRQECWYPEIWSVWSMATKTEGFQEDRMSTAGEDSLVVQFLREAVTASMQFYNYRAKEREKALRLTHNTTQTLRQFMRTQLRRWDEGEAGREAEEDGEVQEDQDTDDEG